MYVKKPLLNISCLGPFKVFCFVFPELSRANLPNVKNILSNLDSSDKSGNNRPREGQYTDKKRKQNFPHI
jgi:hypothetical protein